MSTTARLMAVLETKRRQISPMGLINFLVHASAAAPPDVHTPRLTYESLSQWLIGSSKNRKAALWPLVMQSDWLCEQLAAYDISAVEQSSSVTSVKHQCAGYARVRLRLAHVHMSMAGSLPFVCLLPFAHGRRSIGRAR